MELFNIILIETVNRCTRHCWYCKFGQERQDPGTFWLPDELLGKIADNLEDLGYRGRISPFGINEPLLDRRMPDIIKLLRSRCPQAFISLISNGDLLTGELLDALLQAGLDGLGLSVYDTQGWQRLQPWARHQKVRFLDRRQTLPGWDNRGGEVKQGRWPRRTDWPCLRPFQMMVIRPTGDAVLCCADMYADVVMGNVRNQRLEEIWEGDKFRHYRQILASRTRRLGLQLCATCSHDGTNCSESYPFVNRRAVLHTAIAAILKRWPSVRLATSYEKNLLERRLSRLLGNDLFP